MAGPSLTQRIGILVELSGAERTAHALDQLGDRSLSAGDRVRAGMKVLGSSAGGILGGALIQNFTQALDLGAATSKLTAQLGLTAPESARIGKVAGKVFADNWGDSANAVGDAVASVIRNIDGMAKAGSAALQHVTEQAFAVAVTGSADIADITAAAGQMLRTGLAKSATEAMDILTVGFQKGVDKSHDLLDTFNEYGTHFRVLGLSGQQALGLLSQGLKGGARDADLVGDSLKEFAIRAVDGSVRTANGFRMLGLSGMEMSQQIGKGGKFAADALQLTLDRLRNIRDPVIRAQVAVALFGTQSEDMAKALMSLDPSTAVAALGQVAGAADKAGKALGGDARTQFTAFIRTLQTAFVNVIGGDVVPILQTLGSTIGAVLVPALGIAATVLGSVAKVFGLIPKPALVTITAIAGVALAIKALGTSVAVGTALQSVVVAFANATAGATTFSGRLRGLASAAGTGLANAAGGIGVLSASIGLAVVGLGVYALFQAQAARTAAEHKMAVDSLSGALKESKGVIDENVRATAAKTLSDAKMFDFARRIGVSQQTLTDAYLGNAAAIKTVNKAYDDFFAKQSAMPGNTASDAVQKEKGAWDNLVGSLGDATQANKDQAAAVGATATASGKASTATQALTDKQAAAAKAAQDEKDALDKLKTALDELNGIHKNTIQASLSFNDAVDAATLSVQTNGKTLDQNTDKGRANWKALLAIADAAADVSKAHVDAGDSVQVLTDDLNKNRQVLINHAMQMGYTKAQATALADSILGIPTEVSTTTALPNYPTTKDELLAIFQGVTKIPKGWTTHLDAISTEAQKVLKAMNLTVTHLPDGTYQVSANTYPAALALSRFLIEARKPEIKIPIVSYVRSGGATSGEHSGGSTGAAVSIVVNGKVVGGAAGGAYKSGVVSGPGTDTSDSVFGGPWLSNDEFVVRAAMSRKHRALLWDINNDRLDKVGLAGQKMSVRGMAGGGVFSPEGPKIITRWDLASLGAALGKAIHANWLDVTPHQVIGASGGAYTGGGALGEWIARAIAWTGVPADWARPLRALIMHESGGDPNIQNNWDRNALAGTPSIGLAQVIAPTFAAYRDPRLPNNLRDPVANLVASLNYIRGHYGDIRHIASYVNDDLFVGGYKDGGIVPDVPGGKGFGLLHSGERVLTKAEQQTGEIDYAKLGQAVARALVGALVGLRVEMDGRAVGRLMGASATRIARGV